MKDDIRQSISNKTIVGLAPMAGFSDSAFRRMCRNYGADIVYSELISARGIVEDYQKKDGHSLDLARFCQEERPMLIQIFGNEPTIMAEAAKIVDELFNPDGIDINMGCPAPKVIANDYGASLLKDPKLASLVVENVREALPNKFISVKTRLGWEDDREIVEFAPILEESGADMVAIHCRTKKAGFSGEANWEMLREIGKLTIPYLVNGGIKTWEDIDVALGQSGAKGALIGQAAIGRPWIFREYCQRGTIDYSLDEVILKVRQHLEFYLGNSGNYNELKKQLLGYFKSFENSSKIRSAICLTKDGDELKAFLNNL